MTASSKIARPYAKAAFAFALAHAQEKTWATWLAAAAYMVQQERVVNWLKDPVHSPEEILDVFFKTLGKALDQHGKNFLCVLSAYKRLEHLPEIFRLFKQLLADHEKTMEVEVISQFDRRGVILSEDVNNPFPKVIKKGYKKRLIILILIL